VQSKPSESVTSTTAALLDNLASHRKVIGTSAVANCTLAQLDKTLRCFFLMV
jgi:hypothetical protein